MNRNILLLLCTAGAFFSCKKQEGNIIIDGQGDNNQFGLNRTDTFSLNAVTVREDSLPGNNLRYALIGQMNDPVFGKVAAGAYAQMGLLEPNSDFPNTETADSAVLFIPFISGINFYGERFSNIHLKIAPVTSAISGSSVYYQNTSFDTDESLLTEYYGPVYHYKADSIRYKKGKIMLEPGLRIRLSAAMANRLMTLPKEAYTSQDKFLTHFHGLSVLPEDQDLSPGKGGLGIYDFNNVINLGYRAKVMLFYRDTETFVFTFNGSKTTVNTAGTGPYPTAITQQLSQPSASFPLTYVQAPNGIKSLIRMPHLFNLIKDGNVAINRAEIVFYVDKASLSDNFTAPPRLNLFQPAGKTSDRNAAIEDGAVSTYGGTYQESDGSYRFTITKHIQNLLNAKYFNGEDLNLGLYLTVPSDQPVTGSRAVIDHSKTKLTITYTRMN